MKDLLEETRVGQCLDGTFLLVDYEVMWQLQPCLHRQAFGVNAVLGRVSGAAVAQTPS